MSGQGKQIKHSVWFQTVLLATHVHNLEEIRQGPLAKRG